MNENFRELESAKPDPIMQANTQWPDFKANHPDAINTTVGLLLDPVTGKPWRPQSVIEALETAQQAIDITHTYGYQKLTGSDEFLQAAKDFTFGKELQPYDSILSYQALGGTGALSIARDTIEKLVFPHAGEISMFLDSGWPNHPAIFNEPYGIWRYDHINSATGNYYHESATHIARISKAQVMLLQTCGYNDDGADRTKQQWDDMVEIAKQNNAVVILDSAYLGLADGPDEDRYPIEQFVKSGLLTFVSFSASKNMGLYGERVGALFIANARQQLGDKQYANLDNTVKRVIRRTVSNMPLHAAEAAGQALSTADYNAELTAARDRLNANRAIFASHVRSAFPTVGSGRGLFAKLFNEEGFSDTQQQALADAGILTLQSSRINLGGMTADQTERVGLAVMRLL